MIRVTLDVERERPRSCGSSTGPEHLGSKVADKSARLAWGPVGS